MTPDTETSYCEVQFSGYVGRAKMYQLTIGTHHGPAYTFDEMQQMRWNLDLHLVLWQERFDQKQGEE